ncbi:hypothetical protein EXIGLDRAFT_753795 [Exidia glandulosa HHB12029]|uniref:DNA repair metallo-beta-lactamase domain-containing protein n=1 Tax=Exidia glandulosa HHB12029 TaxID=1314781 RepID=A0A165DH09_EXIGL|nr:hypothetical protein EXIGLDRAFT_753795 [Exidia glandulosa HHB12029]
MPTGTPNYGLIPPFNIRVDTFHTPRDEPFSPPALYLLSHTHTDHTVGLSAKSFSSRVVCSPDARQMLLAMEPAADRIAVDNGKKALRNRPFSHLKIDPVTREDGSVDYSMTRDLLLALPLNTPRVFELSGAESVTITLIDANHCLGAVMFLVEGEKGAVLHTGDFRAEPAFLASLRMNPLLQRYITPKFSFSGSDNGPTRTLDAIYLDTACMLSTHQVPSKVDATEGLVQLMALFPAKTRFFLNCWTWGYEDILKAVASAFQSKIHVDRYKYSVFMKTSDPFLKALVSLDENVSRFHACERHDRCKQIDFPRNTESIVYVNPVDMSVERWDAYLKETRTRLEAGEPLTNLIVPLARHSPLPELQAFVKMFRPKCVVPNTLDPALHGVDYAAMVPMFEDCLAPGGGAVMKDQMLSERISLGPASLSRKTVEPRDGLKIQLENFVGLEGTDDAEDLAKWAEAGKGWKMQVLKDFLPDTLKSALDRVLSAKKPAPAVTRRKAGSDDETTDDEQSYVASLDFHLTSSPLAGRSQEGKMFDTDEASTTPKRDNAPQTPKTLRRQRSMPDVSPTATPKSSQRSKGKGKCTDNTFELLGLSRPERSNSEPQLNPLGTPFSSPLRTLKRKRNTEETVAKAGPLLRRTSTPRQADREATLEATDPESDVLPLQSSRYDTSRRPVATISRPWEGQQPGPSLSRSSSKRPATLAAAKSAPSGDGGMRKRVKQLPQPEKNPRAPSVRPSEAGSLGSTSRKPVTVSRKSTLLDARSSSDESTSVVPDSQDSGVSAVLRRKRTVTEEEIILPISVPGPSRRRALLVADSDKDKERRRRLKEQTRRMSDIQHEEPRRPDFAATKRSKTEGDVEPERKRLKTKDRVSAGHGDRQLTPLNLHAHEPFGLEVVRPTRQLTPLNFHSYEPFGLEVTVPGVGFNLRDSQGGVPAEEFDY